MRKLLLAAAMALLLESSNALAVLVLQVWFLLKDAPDKMSDGDVCPVLSLILWLDCEGMSADMCPHILGQVVDCMTLVFMSPNSDNLGTLPIVHDASVLAWYQAGNVQACIG